VVSSSANETRVSPARAEINRLDKSVGKKISHRAKHAEVLLGRAKRIKNKIKIGKGAKLFRVTLNNAVGWCKRAVMRFQLWTKGSEVMIGFKGPEGFDKSRLQEKRKSAGAPTSFPKDARTRWRGAGIWSPDSRFKNEGHIPFQTTN